MRKTTNIATDEAPLPQFATMARALRIQRGLTLDALADRTGISRAYLWRLESGRSTNPSDRISRQLAKFFDVKLSQLLGEADPNTRYDSDEGLIRLSRSLTPNQRRLIVELMMSLAAGNGHDADKL